MTTTEILQLGLDVIGNAFLAGLLTVLVFTALGKSSKLF